MEDTSTGKTPIIGTENSRKEKLANVSDFSSQKRGPRLPCYANLPSRNRDFFDRTDTLSQLEDALLPTPRAGPSTIENRGLRTFAICGPGGIGKTQVATEFAISHKDDFDAVLWFHAEDAAKLANDFSHVAVELGLVLEGSQDARNLVVTRDLVIHWLAKPVKSYKRMDRDPHEGASWLVVFDNLGDRGLLLDLLPPGGSSGSVLITSRDPLAKTLFYGITNGLNLEPFKKDDASSFLLKLTWREDDLKEAEVSHTVAERLECYPLALTQMASIMIRQFLSFEDFLQRYNEEEAHHALLNLSFEERLSPGSYVHTMASVWALEELKFGASLLDIISLLDPDGIPESALKASIGKLSLQGFPQTTTEYHEARYELLAASLVSRDSVTDRITVHRLMQDVARAKMTADRLNAVVMATIDLMNLNWPSAGFAIRHNITRWVECEKLSPHLVRLRDRFKRVPKACKDRWMMNVGWANLLNELGWYRFDIPL